MCNYRNAGLYQNLCIINDLKPKKEEEFILFPHLSAGFWGHFKGGFEGPSLLSSENGAWSFGPPWILPIIPLPLASNAFLWLNVQLLIITFLCRKSHFLVCFFLCGITRATLTWQHPFRQWQSADKFIFILSCFGRFTPHTCPNQRRHMCFWYSLINLLQKEKATCTIRLTKVCGELCEICPFVTELDSVSWVIYRPQLCLIFTESIFYKNTIPSARWKKQYRLTRQNFPHGTKESKGKFCSDFYLGNIDRLCLSLVSFLCFYLPTIHQIIKQTLRCIYTIILNTSATTTYESSWHINQRCGGLPYFLL